MRSEALMIALPREELLSVRPRQTPSREGLNPQGVRGTPTQRPYQQHLISLKAVELEMLNSPRSSSKSLKSDNTRNSVADLDDRLMGESAYSKRTGAERLAEIVAADIVDWSRQSAPSRKNE